MMLEKTVNRRDGLSVFLFRVAAPFLLCFIIFKNLERERNFKGDVNSATFSMHGPIWTSDQ
jgi:hypothetical protein